MHESAKVLAIARCNVFRMETKIYVCQRSVGNLCPFKAKLSKKLNYQCYLETKMARSYTGKVHK